MNNSPRGRGTDKVQPSPHLAHLTLPELRAYRQHLNDEEERVSYWRRLVQARLDVLSAATQQLDALTPADLVRALGDTGNGSRRQALLRVTSDHPLPGLPGLRDVWSAQVDPHDDAAVAAARKALLDAEQRLTDYRTAMHARLSAATSELISRYMHHPEAAFDLIPPTD